MNLSAAALRILGYLMEKESTTPDVYPLSLNSLIAACNQLSNREPVMSLSEADVRNAVNALRQEGLVRTIQPSGSKVLKFQHLLTEKLDLDARERAVMCVLMLRGAQTLGEIRSRTARLADFPALSDVETTIQDLTKRQLVAEVARRPGQKESRYVQLMGDTPAVIASRLHLVALIVREYHPAIRFFVDILGFELAEDLPSLTNDGRPKRWVVVRPPVRRREFFSRAPTARRNRASSAISLRAAPACSCASTISMQHTSDS